MANNDAELRIGANIGALTEATNKATGDVRKMADNMQAILGTLNSAFQKIHGTFMAFTAVLVGGAAFKSVINASNEWAGDSAKLAKALGTTTEQASVMKVALTHIGAESDTVVAASQKMSKQIFSNGAAFETMGIKVKDSSGQYRPVLDVMGEANQKLAAIKNPIEQSIAGMQLYGKSWSEVKPILKLTTDVMAEAERRAKELHLIVGPEGAAQARQYKEQMRDLNLVGKSLEVQFGQALTPVFVKLGQWMGEEAPAMGNVFARVLESIAFVAQSVWLALKDMGDSLGALAAQAAALMSGDLAAVREIGRLRDQEAAKNEAAYERMKANFGKPMESRASSAPETKGASYDFKGDSGSNKADKSRMSAWESQLSEAKVFFQKTYEMREYSKEQEMEYWQSVLRLAKVTGQERIAVTKKVSELELEIMKKKLQQQNALAAEEINEREKSAGAAISMEEQLAQREYDLGSISRQELLSLQAQYEDRRFEISRGAQAARIAATLGDPNMDPVALQKLLDQMAEIQRAHALRAAKINGDAAVNSKNQWESMLSPITSAFDKSITGMIMGTTKLKAALSHLFQSILGEFVSMCVKMVVKWVTSEEAKSVATKTWSLMRALFEKIGLIEAAAAQETAATATVATNEVMAQSAAGLAAVNAMASVAEIPIVGWAMAPEVGAGVYAVAQGFAATAAASGGYDIPRGVNPVTQLHQEEMVLPAHLANPLRDSLASGGGAAGGGDVHLHVHTMDVKGVRDWMKKNASSVIVPAVRDINRRYIKI